MAYKIESLTAEQKAKFPFYIDKWTDIGLSIKPADRTLAEEGVRESYKIAGLVEPRIVWCSSPMAQGIVRATVLQLQEKFKKGEIKIGKEVGASVRASVGASVRDSVRASVWDSVGDSVRDSVRASVRASVWASVRDSVGDSVWASVGASVGASGYGQHDANWLGFYDFFFEECGLKQETKKLSGLWKIAKAAGWYLPHEHVCWISERPVFLSKDGEGRLHCENRAAIEYPDGWGVYSWHGVRVPEYIIIRPEEITVDKIEKEENSEIRRVMITRYGQEKYLQDSGAKLIDTLEMPYDESLSWMRAALKNGVKPHGGKLFKKDIPNDEPLVMVELINSTPEPDGSIKVYHLRVPPTIKTAKGAIAWTFNVAEHEYQPLVMS